MALPRPQIAETKHFWLWHGLLPLLAFVVLQELVRHFDLDLRLADGWFRLQGNAWALRDNWLTSDLLHSGGRGFSQLLLVLVLVLLGLTWPVRRLAGWRRGLGYLATAALTGVTLVSLGKHFSAQDCPWSLTRYGGDRPYHPLFDAISGDGGGGCFPAGHASAGYAWLALYFVCLHYWPARARLALLPGLALGLAFGAAQQLRGAHFLSHDLWTLAICWFSSLLLYRWMLMPHNRGITPG
ncbi:membrane protein [Marinobacterium nitratireducens]|uniref:Membrane protein n=1 Tax=Marinobacterium nitratireducens TaxID=518897 RepID=A0A918DSN3_9GAMM|nr:membrane protein [Marinobacterium nitratireducens]